MRLFITADLPEEVTGALQDNLGDLAAAGLPGRLVAPTSLHLTLAFLGDRPESDLDAIAAAMQAAADETTAFEVALGDYGTFGEGPHGIWWQGLSDDSEVTALAHRLWGYLEQVLGKVRQAEIEAETAAAAGAAAAAAAEPWTRPATPFAAHITLARHVDLSQVDRDALDEPWVDVGDVASLTLYRSHLTAEGATYEPLRTVALSPAYVHPEGRLLLVDADGCPVTRESIAQAKRAGVPVLLVGNGTQNLEKHLRESDPRTPRKGFWAATMNVLGGADSADFQIATTVRAGDVVVTQDIGVAAMALGAGASAIGVRGREYTLAGIDAALLVRHEEKKLRRQGGRTAGPHAFTDEDRQRFSRSLARMLARTD